MLQKLSRAFNGRKVVLDAALTLCVVVHRDSGSGGGRRHQDMKYCREAEGGCERTSR
jgi:hypothetical protein